MPGRLCGQHTRASAWLQVADGDRAGPWCRGRAGHLRAGAGLRSPESSPSGQTPPGRCPGLDGGQGAGQSLLAVTSGPTVGVADAGRGGGPWVLDAGTSPLKAGPCWALQAGRVGAAATVRPGRPLLSPRRPCSQKPSTSTWHRLWLQTELKPLVLSVFGREEWCNRAPVRKRGHRAAPRHSPLGLLRYATGPSRRLLCPIHTTPRVTPRGQGCGRLLATGCSDGRLPGARQAP